MNVRDIIVVGASLGGIRVLRQLCSDLPADLPAAVFVVCHTAAEGPRVLAEILNNSGPLPAAFGQNGEPIRPGCIYVAPPDKHLLLTQDGVQLSHGARENRFRPAIDPLFRSAAIHFGRRVIGVILTGLLDDGMQGLWFVKRRGGVCIVQDPREAEAPSMPQSAIDEGVVDHIVTVADMPVLLRRLLSESSHPMKTPPHLHPHLLHGPGPQVPVTCTDCNGALWLSNDVAETSPSRYECHVGHQFSERGLASAKLEELEAGMWTALRVLKENAALLGTMAERARAGGRLHFAEQLERTRQQYHDKAQIIQRAIDGTA